MLVFKNMKESPNLYKRWHIGESIPYIEYGWLDMILATEAELNLIHNRFRNLRRFDTPLYQNPYTIYVGETANFIYYNLAEMDFLRIKREDFLAYDE